MDKKIVYALVGTLLSWGVGYLGADRFYKGDVGLGLLKLITLGGLGVWYLVDALLWTRDLGVALSEQ